MKIIFVTILLTISLFGQIPDSVINSLRETEKMLLAYEMVGVDTLEINPNVAKALVNAYDKYKKECYADSTLGRAHKTFYEKANGHSIFTVICPLDMKGNCEDASHYENVWTHRKPTFEGFIEYLEKYIK